jgi:hypothetical protein
MSENENMEADLSSASEDTLKVFMDVADDRGIFKEILDSNKSRSEVVKMLVEHPDTPDEVRSGAVSLLRGVDPAKAELARKKALEARKKQEEAAEEKKERLTKQIQKLGIGEKIKLAAKAGGEARRVLLKESSKLVMLAVLENPRITDSEVEVVAKNRSSPDDVLRAISKNKEWMRNYSLRHTVVTNPKTPAGISMRLVRGLKKRDLQLIEKDKNLPEGVRLTAKKILKSN